ncbi:hypothetical protein PFISCL1PPCAC_8845, partial [Pristionchus fissidentatus]
FSKSRCCEARGEFEQREEKAKKMPHLSTATRHINVNSTHQPVKFCDNVISTCKYSPLSFIPRFLYEQFRRYNNIFFLCIALLQQIPDVSPTGRYTTLFPFCIILLISALKEIFEDLKRRTSDKKVNNFPTKILLNGSWKEARWRDGRVGEIIRVENDALFPADLLLISSSEQQGMAYIETSNLDGETNLKIKQSLPTTSHLTSLDTLARYHASIECEHPNRHVNEFSGNLHCEGEESKHFGIDQLLLRGARLKNTEWICGAVIYTGHDAKILLNSKLAPLKQSNVDVMTNRRILVLFFVLVSLAIISAIGAEIYNSTYVPEAWYISWILRDGAGFLWNVLTFFILYNNLIPISLQVTLELVRFFQASFINNDLGMYHADSDSCAVARTSNLNEELGQVKFVMSDKTGTLTQNIMKWKRASVGGVSYGDSESDEFSDEKLIADYKSAPDSPQGTAIRELLTMMACCHTVVPEHKEGKLLYQGSSPDEIALVKGAASQGAVFHTRQPQRVVLNMLGSDESIEVLDVIDFTSDRKRMSVIVRSGDGRFKLYTKGADTVIFDRIGDGSRATMNTQKAHLEEYASFGYRTLCFAMREIPQDRYTKWSADFKAASLKIDDRQKAIDACAEEIERELELIGSTAIEDKLQQYVPETIQALMAADIRVWMLTGDKRETAINIAHSCALCTHNTELMIVDKYTYDETYDKLTRFATRAKQFEEEGREFAMVIDGKSLVHALTGEARAHFGELALRCKSVVCCRMSPMQKAEVVEMVRGLADHVVLAVGDGANDVAMIQAANVGVGISGEEGLQAASASDYAVAQFHFLRRLLLLHGAWNFDRSVKVILYSFYKNICLYIIELWFAIFSAWSGQTIFERWTIGMFNVLFTALPPIALGLFDRPVDEEQMTRFPALYCSFQKRAFSLAQFCMWIGLAVLHSLMLFALTYAVLEEGVVWAHGRDGGWLMLGNCCYTFVVTTVCLKALLECDSWTWPVIASCVGSIVAWLLFLILYAWVFPIGHLSIGADMAGMAWVMMSSLSGFWLALIFVPATTLLWDLVIKSFFTITHPTPREMAVLYQKRHAAGGFERLTRYGTTYSSGVLDLFRGRTRVSTDEFPPGSEPIPIGQLNLTRRSSSSMQLAEEARYGYAFSQEEDGPISQHDMVAHADSTQPKPTGR